MDFQSHIYVLKFLLGQQVVVVTARYFVFTISDCYPEPEWFRAYTQGFKIGMHIMLQHVKNLNIISTGAKEQFLKGKSKLSTNLIQSIHDFNILIDFNKSFCIKQMLQTLNRQQKHIFHWIPSHVSLMGIETANLLRKRSARISCQPSVPRIWHTTIHNI